MKHLLTLHPSLSIGNHLFSFQAPARQSHLQKKLARLDRHALAIGREEAQLLTTAFIHLAHSHNRLVRRKCADKMASGEALALLKSLDSPVSMRATPSSPPARRAGHVRSSSILSSSSSVS